MAAEAAEVVAAEVVEGTDAALVGHCRRGTLWASEQRRWADAPPPAGVRPSARQLSLVVRRLLRVLPIAS